MSDFTLIDAQIAALLPVIEAAQAAFVAVHGRYCQCMAGGLETTDTHDSWDRLGVASGLAASIDVAQDDSGWSWTLTIEHEGYRRVLPGEWVEVPGLPIEEFTEVTSGNY